MICAVKLFYVLDRFVDFCTVEILENKLLYLHYSCFNLLTPQLRLRFECEYSKFCLVSFRTWLVYKSCTKIFVDTVYVLRMRSV